MSGSIFGRLQQQLDIQNRAEGISALDLAQLPPGLRKIMRLMLREIEMSHAAILEAMSDQPEPDRMKPGDLENALSTLSQQGWLICRGEGDRRNYTVNLRRKQGSSLAGSIFNSLEERIRDQKGSG